MAFPFTFSFFLLELKDYGKEVLWLNTMGIYPLLIWGIREANPLQNPIQRLEEEGVREVEEEEDEGVWGGLRCSSEMH